MPHPRPLPLDLTAAPFRTPEARDRGIGDHRLGAPDLAHPFHGVATTAAMADAIPDRCEEYAPRLLHGQVFSHTTALALWGAPLPWRVRGDVHLSVAFPRTPPRTRGATGHGLRLLEPAMVRGLPVSAVEAAWCEAAAILGREELVAAGDALVTGSRVAGVRRAGLTDVEHLTAAMCRRRRMRGAETARWALLRIRVGVDSPGETALRLLLTRYRLPEPEPDMAVQVDGMTLHGDLGYRDARVLLDYEGDGHRTDRLQWMRDVRRHELFEDAGYRHVRVVAADLREPDPLIARLRRLLASRTLASRTPASRTPK